MYYNHNLQLRIKTLLDRLYLSSYSQFPTNYHIFFSDLKKINLVTYLLEEAAGRHNSIEPQLTLAKENYPNSEFSMADIRFISESDRAAFLHRLNLWWIEQNAEVTELALQYSGSGGDYADQQQSFIHEYIQPIIHFLLDSISESSSVLYLLEKYKFRSENFLGKQLLSKYRSLQKNYEQFLEDDLRLYLFDNGIDNPFSTPKSVSGRADIVGLLDTSDPLIVEIKIFDSERQYRQKKITDGFEQVVRYCNDFNKTTGYLVVFVFDNVEFQLAETAADKTWPQRAEKGGKLIYLVFINLFDRATASVAASAEKILLDFNN